MAVHLPRLHRAPRSTLAGSSRHHRPLIFLPPTSAGLDGRVLLQLQDQTAHARRVLGVAADLGVELAQFGDLLPVGGALGGLGLPADQLLLGGPAAAARGVRPGAGLDRYRRQTRSVVGSRV